MSKIFDEYAEARLKNSGRPTAAEMIDELAKEQASFGAQVAKIGQQQQAEQANAAAAALAEEPRAILTRASAATVGEASDKPIWRCFHCDETFNDAESAALHFGKSEMQSPACLIDIAEYRAMEQRMHRYNEEDTDLHREIHGLRAKHQVDLMREEEKGYARGLADGMKEAAQQQAEPCPICFGYEPHSGSCGSSHPDALCNRKSQQAEPGADERAAFENWMRANRYDVGTFASGEYHNMFARNAWMGWQARAAQSGQRAANLSEATIQALWDEACNDSPQNPGWSRHIRFARAIEQAGQRAGVDAVEIMRICRLFLDEKEGDYDAKACFTAIFKIAAAAPTQQQEG